MNLTFTWAGICQQEFKLDLFHKGSLINHVDMAGGGGVTKYSYYCIILIK